MPEQAVAKCKENFGIVMLCGIYKYSYTTRFRNNILPSTETIAAMKEVIWMIHNHNLTLTFINLIVQNTGVDWNTSLHLDGCQSKY